jgi:hypothetical protein
MPEIILSPHPNISGYCLFVRRPLRDIDDMQPLPGQPSAGQANTSTNNPPSVPRPCALRRPSITRINASNQVTDPMPEQGAYLLVKESLKTVKTQVNAVVKLLPGSVKKNKGRAVRFGAGKGRETILNFYAEDSEDSEDSCDSEADSQIAEQFESPEEEEDLTPVVVNIRDAILVFNVL